MEKIELVACILLANIVTLGCVISFIAAWRIDYNAKNPLVYFAMAVPFLLASLIMYVGFFNE